jgi:hypothetical protein
MTGTVLIDSHRKEPEKASNTTTKPHAYTLLTKDFGDWSLQGDLDLASDSMLAMARIPSYKIWFCTVLRPFKF